MPGGQWPTIGELSFQLAKEYKFSLEAEEFFFKELIKKIQMKPKTAVS